MKIGFITCSDLSRYFPSQKNPLLTHDDQIACDFLSDHNCKVIPVIWGTPIAEVIAENFDLLIVRSPWDYMDSKENRDHFIVWLQTLDQSGVRVANSFQILQWNLDKHYLRDLESYEIPVPPTLFLESHEPLDKICEAQKKWGEIVVKPCISAAAKDTYLIRDSDGLVSFTRGPFKALRQNRAFMIQPFLKEIQTQGEWSLVFLHSEYSHAVWKLPKKGGWLVQDELGGSVTCIEPPHDIQTQGKKAFEQLKKLLKDLRLGSDLLYARVDIVPGGFVGELELIEPELFFLDRRTQKPYSKALELFYNGIRTISAT